MDRMTIAALAEPPTRKQDTKLMDPEPDQPLVTECASRALIFTTPRELTRVGRFSGPPCLDELERAFAFNDYEQNGSKPN
jgi:hypothetical protein